MNKNPKNHTAEEKGMDIYGLRGLLKLIRVNNEDMNTFALGCDLTKLGLSNLNSEPDTGRRRKVLYPFFSTPWADNVGPGSGPDYTLPMCYYMQPPALKTSHLSKFKLETLFYIFYNMPRDALQVYTAKELYNRNWVYHKLLKTWITEETSAEGVKVIVYFDVVSWSRRLDGRNLDWSQEQANIMSREEIFNICDQRR